MLLCTAAAGKKYKEDPTILAWNLINEPRCETWVDANSFCPTAMAGWFKVGLSGCWGLQQLGTGVALRLASCSMAVLGRLPSSTDGGAGAGVGAAVVCVQEMADFTRSADPNHLVTSGARPEQLQVQSCQAAGSQGVQFCQSQSQGRARHSCCWVAAVHGGRSRQLTGCQQQLSDDLRVSSAALFVCCLQVLRASLAKVTPMLTRTPSPGQSRPAKTLWTTTVTWTLLSHTPGRTTVSLPACLPVCLD